MISGWNIFNLIVSASIFVIWLGWFSQGTTLSYILTGLVGANLGFAIGELFT